MLAYPAQVHVGRQPDHGRVVLAHLGQVRRQRPDDPHVVFQNRHVREQHHVEAVAQGIHGALATMGGGQLLDQLGWPAFMHLGVGEGVVLDDVVAQAKVIGPHGQVLVLLHDRHPLGHDFDGGAVVVPHVIALDAVLAAIDLGGQQTDVADIVLGAGMVATGEMDVDRQVDRDPRLEIVGESQRMALGIGGGELAAGIAGAGDQAAADRARLDAQTERIDGGDADADVAVGDVWLAAGQSNMSGYSGSVAGAEPPVPEAPACTSTPFS